MAETKVDTETLSANNGIAIAPKRLSPEQFQERFESLVPLMTQEWNLMAPEELEATDGDLDLTVDLIAEATEHTKTLIHAQLAELHSLSLSWERQDRKEKDPSQPLSHSESHEVQPSAKSKEDDHANSPSIDDVLDLLERRTEQLVERVKADVLPEVKSQAKRNLGASILTALGIGFLLGLFVGGSGGDRK
ncbi:hypothetical protein E1H12_09495 [Geitlerinema sp. P-1104]|uniref:hypothetical protein n=1 Tax=Geitlerinema sp. P-1104 TaxID=2546230 RepID=UPI00147734F2|nr:hypothetical protein [Geitlerinema sp. P-1104]NMG58750.1 hypothetical protein [Geitlerinema sp. P-1104]